MKRKNIIFISSISVLIAFLLVGIFADFLAPYDPNQVDMLNGLAGPSTEHWRVRIILDGICLVG